MKLQLLLATVLAVAYPPSPLPEGTFNVDRSRVLYSDGFVIMRHFDLYPLNSPNKAGVVFERPIVGEDTKRLRVHFVVEDRARSGPWHIECLDSHRNVVWTSTDRAIAHDEFWSGEIQGSSTTVLVYASSQSDGPKIRIDKLSVTGVESKPQAITTSKDDIRPISEQTARVRKLGTSVARIHFNSTDGKTYYCTGFLVGANLLMTNEHCLRTGAEARSALIDFDFDTNNSVPKTVCVDDLLFNDFVLDYAIVQLASVPDGHLPLKLVREKIKAPTNLLLIEHPLGESKQVSLVNCIVTNEAVIGRGPSKTDVAHSCNTMGGSSGSPLIENDLIVALHHFGDEPGRSLPTNQAVEMTFILDQIKDKHPDVYSKMNVSQP